MTAQPRLIPLIVALVISGPAVNGVRVPSPSPGWRYDAGFNEYLGFLCDAFPAIFVNPTATCAALAGAGIPTKAVNLNYPSIGISQVPGAKTVTRTVTSVAKESSARTYTANVVAPSGYTVTVSPSTIKLKKGQSATFSVTVTNVSAPIGQWRFGSLTWNEVGGNYKVYSPIAVKAALFEGPAEVSGSYQVSFGYTGPFSATARGLVPATTFNHAVNTNDFICDFCCSPCRHNLCTLPTVRCQYQPGWHHRY